MGSGYQGQKTLGEVEEEDRRGEQQPEEKGRHATASAFSPGLDGKASPTRGLPATTAPLCRKPDSPHLWEALSRAGTGCRRLKSGSEGLSATPHHC